MLATGLPAVADDTGLEVDALGGAPGVDAAHYAGEGCSYADNRSKLLAELAGVDRSARSVQDGGDRGVARRVRTRTSRVSAAGVITTEERGEIGFGYDSVFQPDEGDGATFAEMGLEAKNAISHRGRAFRALLIELAQR